MHQSFVYKETRGSLTWALEELKLTDTNLNCYSNMQTGFLWIVLP